MHRSFFSMHLGMCVNDLYLNPGIYIESVRVEISVYAPKSFIYRAAARRSFPSFFADFP